MEATAAQNWTLATRRLDRLPTGRITIQWDPTGVPAAQRADYLKARDEAIAVWQRTGVLNAANKSLPARRLIVRFVPVMNQAAGSTMPLGAALDTDPATGVSTLVVGLRRGGNRAPTRPNDVRNEIAYSISKMLGLADSPLFGFINSRTDQATDVNLVPAPGEVRTAQQVLATADLLRQAVRKREALVWRAPETFLDPREFRPEPFPQGTKVPFTFQLTNAGEGPLSYRAIGDCGCVLPPAPGTLGPGETVLLRPVIDTTEFVGLLDKRLILITNDPDRPTITIPIRTFSQPQFRWFEPANRVQLLDDAAPGGSAEVTLRLAVQPGLTLDPNRAQVQGVPGATVVAEPWTETLPDAELKESPKARQGFRFRVRFDPNTVIGRMRISVTVPTPGAPAPFTTGSVAVQRGIVTLPFDLYLGRVDAKGKRVASLVSRPGKPFRILSITSDHPNVRATARDTGRGDEYRIETVYDGKGKPGDLSGTIRIRTNDPAQPEIMLPFRGLIS